MPELADIANKLLSWDVRSVKLSGGEPTVRNDLTDIIDTFHRFGIKSVVITNGIRLKADHIAALKRTSGAVKFSIHFPDERNDEVLGNKSFDKVLANLRGSITQGLDVGVNCVVSARNAHVLEEMVEFACREKCRKISFIPVVFRGLALDALDQDDMNNKLLDSVRERCSQLSRDEIEVRIIDIRSKDYWVIENNGDLLIERDLETNDTKILSNDFWST